MIATLAVAAIPVVLVMLLQRGRLLRLRREAFIREFELPRGLFEQLRKRNPALGLKECQLVSHALRQFFLAHLKSGRKYVSMPSQVADDLWHEFILNTRSYEQFCRRAFGKFLHHTPAVAVAGSAQSDAGLRRCWWFVCLEEHINPRKPTRLPLLFALDAKLDVPNGFRYVADCAMVRRQGADGSSNVQCGADLGSGYDGSSGDGGSSSAGNGGNDPGSGGGGDSGGDSGGGCGGGGCGGD